MYRKIQDFITDWRYKSESTSKTFKHLTNATLSYKVWEDGRTLGYLAWHIVLTLGEMSEQMGLKVTAPTDISDEPKNVEQIISAYEIAAKSLIEELKTKWNDAMLLDEIEMYGEKWFRGNALSSLLRHEIHHRAQITVLMRQAGLKVPGIYGPSKEEWAKMGMPEQK